MNAESGSGRSGTFIWGVIAGIVVVAGAGGLFLSGISGGDPEGTAPQTDVAVQPTDEVAQSDDATSADVSEDSTSVPDTAAPEEAAEVAPTLDQIFVERDGNAVLSGNAEPGADVRVLLDGEQVHSFTVDPSGQFAEFVSIPFSNDARGLTLEVAGGDQPVRSDDYVIAALPAPEPEDKAVTGVETAENLVPDVPDAEAPAAEASAPTDGEAEVAEAPAQPVEDQPDQTAQAPAEETADDAPGQQIAILRSGEDGVELVQPLTPQPGAPDQVALDTIGYSNAGGVELTGRVPDGSAIRLYLDNRLVADLAPAEDGKWRSELEGIDPGVYTLRLDEVAADGTVVSRLETPFKREPLDVLRAADVSDTPATEAGTPAIRSVTVQEGDTLWALSRERFGDGVLYVKLFEANRGAIRDPDLIYPGQVFTIPE
ncbi:LysM peptidoglycan-binding domain-containing protein [Ruegeria halocynthiae]|uniref:LysM peptidoglycan-binding domain-containing protein n=1 Tax=Ruegeria halocynthiae TaxID=985054 RepID=UPI0005682B43|nr:LysM peptidoglycan-binding domain-containing protein [Ruegeria halocynthiae]